MSISFLSQTSQLSLSFHELAMIDVMPAGMYHSFTTALRFFSLSIWHFIKLLPNVRQIRPAYPFPSKMSCLLSSSKNESPSPFPFRTTYFLCNPHVYVPFIYHQPFKSWRYYSLGILHLLILLPNAQQNDSSSIFFTETNQLLPFFWKRVSFFYSFTNHPWPMWCISICIIHLLLSISIFKTWYLGILDLTYWHCASCR